MAIKEADRLLPLANDEFAEYMEARRSHVLAEASTLGTVETAVAAAVGAFVPCAYLLLVTRLWARSTHWVGLIGAVTVWLLFGGLAAVVTIERWSAVYGSLRLRQSIRSLEIVGESLDRWRTALRERAVRRFVVDEVNSVVLPSLNLTLPRLDLDGLRQLRPADLVDKTDAARRLRRVLDQLDAGAVALAGPRGAGKTTIIDLFASGAYLPPGGRPWLTLKASAPIEYVGRDFILHLYACLCVAVADAAERSLGTPRGRLPRRWTIRLRRLARRSGVTPRAVLAAGGSSGVAVLVVEGALWLSGAAHPRSPASAIVAAGTALLVLGGYILHASTAGPPGGETTEQEPDLTERMRFLHDEAGRRLLQVRYLQSHTHGWSGELSGSRWLELGGQRSTQRSRQPFTYPGIVHETRAFLSNATEILSDHPRRQVPRPVEVTTDKAPAYFGVLEELLPAAQHITKRYANNRIEADHGWLKARLRPMRGLKRLATAAVIAAGHDLVQNIRRGHYELAVDIASPLRLAAAFTELARAI
jgi:hypothetical protein